VLHAVPLVEPVSFATRSLISASAVVFMILSGESSAWAQGTSGFHVGLSGAAIFPTEAASRDFTTGWGGSAMVIFNPRNSPVSVRAEGTYCGIEASSYTGVIRAKISSGTANVVVGSRGPSGRPYFIAGGGAYDLDFTAGSRTAPFSGKQTRFGWNAGGGIAFPLGGGSSIFVEAHYHSVQTKDSFTFVPVSVGVVF